MEPITNRNPDSRQDLFSALVDRFGQLGGVDLQLPPRATPARPAQLSGQLRGSP